MSTHRHNLADARLRLEEIFTRHAGELTRFARRRVGEDLAADIVSSTFLVACRRLGELPSDDARPWLYGIARLVIANELRGRRRRERLDERIALVASAFATDETEAVTDRLRVHAALAQLPELDREVLRLTEWEQLSPKEAARVLGCTVIAFKSRLHRARRRFSTALRAEDICKTTTDHRAEVVVPAVRPNPAKNGSS